MFTRKNLAVALIATLAQAQQKIKQDIGGEDLDGDERIDQAAAYCSGQFTGEETEKTFWIGVASSEGNKNDNIIGWGKNLCDNEHVEFNSDYSIRLLVEDTATETGQTFTCGKDHGAVMSKVIQGHINDKKTFASFKGIGKSLGANNFTIVDHAFTLQSETDKQNYDIVDQVQADAEAFLQKITQEIEGKLDGLYDSVTVEKREGLSAAVAVSVQKITDKVNKDANLYLLPETVEKFEQLGGQNLLDVTNTVSEQFDKIIQDMRTDLGELIPDVKAQVNDLTQILTDSWAKEAAKISAAIEKEVAIDQEKFEMKIAPIIEKSGKAQDAKLATFIKKTTGVLNQFAAEAKNAINRSYSESRAEIQRAVDSAKFDVETILGEDPGAKNVLKAFDQTMKEIAGLTKGISTLAQNNSKEFGALVVEDVKVQIADQKGQREGYVDDLVAEALGATIGEITDYPLITDTRFNIDTLIKQGQKVTVEVERDLDGVKATCELEVLPAPLDHCHQTHFEDLYFDYLCGMSTSVKWGKEAFSCDPYYRPSNQNCNQLPDDEEDLCAAALQNKMDSLKDIAKLTKTNMGWQWKTIDAIIKLEKKGVSIFNNEYFTDWAMNSSIDSWDCQWDDEEDKEKAGDFYSCWRDAASRNGMTNTLQSLMLPGEDAEEFVAPEKTDDGESWKGWKRWEDYPKKEWEPVTALDKAVAGREKSGNYDRGVQITQALETLFAERTVFGLELKGTVPTQDNEGLDVCEQERQDIGALIFKDYVELLQWNHFFNENKAWFQRTKDWLTTWAKKPQVYVRGDEADDDDTPTEDTDDTTVVDEPSEDL